MQRTHFFTGAFLLFVFLVSCKKEDKTGAINLNFSHRVDAANLQTDSIMYVSAAGYTYSVTNLKYFISGLILTADDNSTETFQGPYYVDFADPATHSHALADVPVAKYKSLRFYIGLDSAHNVSNSLPSTTANNNMAWPDPMGGGYHFLKLEGYYYNPSPSETGFAMHLGKNANLVTCTINDLNFQTSETGSDLNLSMNLNEWFRNPNVYDFNSDGVSIMNNSAAMLKIAQNGADVFTKN